MKIAALIALAIFVGGVALTAVVWRLNKNVGATISLLNGLFGRAAALFFEIWIGVRIAEKGGG